MGDKVNIIEEVNRMKNLFTYKAGKVISEQEEYNEVYPMTETEIDNLNYGNLDDNNKEKVKNFIKGLQKKCDENNITLIIKNEPGIPYVGNDGIMVNGYFDDKSRSLACAAGKDVSLWLPTLIHESSHMDQFLEDAPEWLNNLDMVETDKWLTGDDSVDMNTVTEEIKTAIAVEVDCEKRTVNKIKQLGLDGIIDAKEYIQRANAYLMFYLWMKENRKWYEIGREPYNLPEIFREMPKTFDNDYSELSSELRAVLDKLNEVPKE